MTVQRIAPYAVIIAIAGIVYTLAPEWMPLASRVVMVALFVMSLDLIVGYCGLVSLGHSALWGVGSYSAAILAVHSVGDPIIGLCVGGIVGASVACLSGLVLLRFTGLPFTVLTIAFSQVVLHLASKFRSITGGDDGLSGFVVGKLFGVFEFDLEGRTAFLYCVGVLLCSLVVLRTIVASPFGYACRGIEQNRMRMEALGIKIRPTLLKMYTVSGLFAGIAGTLSTQVNQVTGLDSLSFALSAEALVMLVLGGTGTLVGGIAGAAFFTVVHHTASTMNPYHWLFVIGTLLIVAALSPRAILIKWYQRTSRVMFRTKVVPEVA